MKALQGLHRVDTIDYRYEPYDWSFVRDEAPRVDAHWAALRAEKPALYDGRVLVAHRWTLDPSGGGHLSAAGFETSYKAFLGWRDFGFPGAPVANLFAMGALRSADGVYILGEMAPGTASAGYLYFPAGTPEPSDVVDGIVDLEGNMRREIEEETGLTAQDIALQPGWTLVGDEARLACLKDVLVPLGIDEILARFSAFQAGQADPELAALVAVREPADLDAARMPRFMLTFLREAFARG